MNAAPQYGLARSLLVRTKLAGGSLRISGGLIHAKGVPPALLAELKAHRAEVVTLLTDPLADTPPAKPITRAVLRFTLRHGGGTVLGQPTDTPASLLADLLERWPGELLAAWQDTKQIYPSDREPDRANHPRPFED